MFTATLSMLNFSTIHFTKYTCQTKKKTLVSVSYSEQMQKALS